MRALTMFAIACAALVGCTDAIIMRDPKTGESTDCGGHYSTKAFAALAAQRDESCVADYRAQGWLRVPK